jgi:FKBP-type peptidyl-prolyl cis-trans isomerase 2
MQTAQPGDLVRVHYRKCFQDGSVTTSRVSAPLELTVGSEHPRLPGLGLGLVGLAAGATITVQVPKRREPDPSRIRRWPRSRFSQDQTLAVGEWVPVHDRHGRRRSVRVLELGESAVLVDTNHRRAGLLLVLEIELIAIESPASADPVS